MNWLKTEKQRKFLIIAIPGILIFSLTLLGFYWWQSKKAAKPVESQIKKELSKEEIIEMLSAPQSESSRTSQEQKEIQKSLSAPKRGGVLSSPAKEEILESLTVPH